MNRHDKALQVLLVVRRRLLDRMASVVVENQRALLNGQAPPNNPLAASADLVEIIKNLDKLDNAIAGLAGVSQDDLPSDAASPATAKPTTPQQDGIFGTYCRLVARNRLEQASRELSRILHMPLDRVITATRFFARTFKVNPSVADELAHLCEPGENWSEAQCLRALIKTFGFQSVESRMAIQALRARMEAEDRDAINA